MLPESGRKLSNSILQLTNVQLSEQLGAALRGELGSSRQATKTVMAWTGVCDRAARNWISGIGGLSGLHLLQVARQSEAVWRLVLELSARPEAALGFELHAVEVALSRALGTLETLKRQASRR